MSLGALAFLNPWLLAALASLPLIYWLLRTVPPRPKQIAFPPTRILVGLENRDKTPAKTPWWLLLIRLLAATLVILALADPVINAAGSKALKGTGPLVVVLDNGWAAAARWNERLAQAERLVGEAEAGGRPLVIVPTAIAAKAATIRVEAPTDARSTIAALRPEPFAPGRKAMLPALQSALKDASKGGVSVVWLTDGIDHDGEARTFADALIALASEGTFAVVDVAPGRESLGVAAGVTQDGKLGAKVLRTEGSVREGAVHAFSARGARLGEAPFKLAEGESEKELTFDLPLELRNQVTRVELSGEHSAGAVSLLDAGSQWQRIGLISGESQEQSQPLLAPLYYLQKAVQPFAEVVRPKDQNLAQGIRTALDQKVSIVMLADIGTLSGEAAEHLDAWVRKGGVLVRFAGPRLEKGGDELLPVALRLGGRTLGGALSWSTPQPLNEFDDASPFTGLAVPKDVTIERQVLADPARLTPEVKVWARLKDGTPLVTARRHGQGQLVLFHVTANTDWSNLPISGLFVDMLRRITTIGGGAPSPGPELAADKAGEPSATTAGDSPAFLAPVQTLDGFGVLKPPPPTAESIAAAKIAATTATFEHPPGYYGPAGAPHAVNVLGPKSALSALPPMPAGTEHRAYEADSSRQLKPWLLAAALALVFADIIAVLLMQGGVLLRSRQGQAGAAALVLIAVVVVQLAVAAPAQAQLLDDRGPPPEPQPTTPDGIAQRATERVTFGYVLTGDAATDRVSRLGLSGLGRVLAVRTSVEPGEPIGVDITSDEIAFYPVLYWPVVKNPQSLPEAALAKIDAYMKQGGLIIFDTRDYSSGLPTGMAMAGESGPALQKLLGRLDVPRLEPVPEDHVLTKSFYLLQSFPGRWDGGQMWVEAQNQSEDGGRKARRADGVTSIIVTSNDFASAWALDATGRPLYPTVPGGERQREMSLRSGINIVMHALTGNYKADQVHVPALLERLGQ